MPPSPPEAASRGGGCCRNQGEVVLTQTLPKTEMHELVKPSCGCCVILHSVFTVPDSKMRMRRRAVRALMSHTQNAIRDLRNDEDEMLRGADSFSDSAVFPPTCPNAYLLCHCISSCHLLFALVPVRRTV